MRASIKAFTQFETGMVRIWVALPIRSTMTQCSSLCWISSTRNIVALSSDARTRRETQFYSLICVMCTSNSALGFTVNLTDWGSAEAKFDKIAAGPTRDDGIPPMT
jgi:hypothetical protein